MEKFLKKPRMKIRERLTLEFLEELWKEILKESLINFARKPRIMSWKNPQSNAELNL